MNNFICKKKLFKNSIGIRLPYFFRYINWIYRRHSSLLFRINLPVSRIRVKKILSTTQFDTSIEETGFIPPYSLKEGLSKTIQYEFIDNNKINPHLILNNMSMPGLSL